MSKTLESKGRGGVIQNPFTIDFLKKHEALSEIQYGNYQKIVQG